MTESPWTKVVMFVLGAIMLAGLAHLILDPGLGRADDESRRIRNLAGFSITCPRGWSANLTSTSDDDRSGASIHLSPDHPTGRPPSIVVKQLPSGPVPLVNAKPITFQGQPARAAARQGQYLWTWRVQFERGSITYEISLSTPIAQDPDSGPLRPFIDSFAAEPRPATGPAVTPATTRAAE